MEFWNDNFWSNVHKWIGDLHHHYMPSHFRLSFSRNILLFWILRITHKQPTMNVWNKRWSLTNRMNCGFFSRYSMMNGMVTRKKTINCYFVYSCCNLFQIHKRRPWIFKHINSNVHWICATCYILTVFYKLKGLLHLINNNNNNNEDL